MATSLPVDLTSIQAARRRIAPHIRRTPLWSSPEAPLWLKCENQQITGSFKLRGALSRILGLSRDEARRGVIAASAGNHGQGVALAARLRNLSARVVVAETAVAVKVAAIRALGAEVIQVPGGYAEAEAEGHRLAEELGLTWVSPYNDVEVVAGQGTLGLELAEELSLERAGRPWEVFVPASGGGLLSGVGVALKGMAPSVRVIGVQPNACPYLHAYLKGGDMSAVVEGATIADGLTGPVEAGSVTLDILPAVVDDVVLVGEDEIEAAMRWAQQAAGQAVEPSAAVALAAARREPPPGVGRIVVLSGGNVSPELLQKVMAGDPSNGR